MLFMDVDELYKTDPALKVLGIKLLSVGSGKAVMTMEVGPQMLNGYGICHGGFIFTLADSAFAYACNSYDFNAVAQNCVIDFVRKGITGNVLTAIAEEKNLAGRTGLYDITVSNENNEVVAYFRGKSYRIK